MELSGSKVKKFLTFLEIDPYTFRPKLKKIKTNVPQENSLYSGKMDLSNSNIKKLLTFSQKKVVFIFQETQTTEKCLIFSQKKDGLIF